MVYIIYGGGVPERKIVLRVFMTAYVGTQIMGRHVGFCQIVDAHVVGPSLAVIQSEVHQISEPLHRPAWVAGSSQDAHIDFSHLLTPCGCGWVNAKTLTPVNFCNQAVFVIIIFF